MALTRNQARAANLKTYNTGRPCRYGHQADRYTASGTCVECARGYQRGQVLPAPVDAMRQRSLDLVDTTLVHALETYRAAAAEATRAREQINAAAAVAAHTYGRLFTVKLRARVDTIDELAAAVRGVTVARYPELDGVSLGPIGEPSGQAGATSLYTFKCHHDDVAALHRCAEALL